MALIVLRALFILVSAGLAVFILCLDVIRSSNAYVYWGVFIGILFIAVSVIVVNVAIPRKQLGVITSIYFGLIVGLFLAYVAGLALTPFLPAPWFPDSERVKAAVQLVLAAVLCYTCVSFLLQTRNDFRFIIPYVEFSKEVKGRRPYILDTSVVIDGRIADVVVANIFDTHLIMPRFVITELQAIADSSDRLRRSRGRRGLDILNNLRVNPKVELEIYDRELPEFAGQSVNLKLVALAKHVVGKLVTNDYNLNKVARLNGVEVVNLNDLANALKPVFLPGERVEVRLVRAGEEVGQGVGYLDDGTMVVVEGGRDHLNENVCISVTSVLQTSAGRMVFGRYEASRREEAAPPRAGNKSEGR